MTDNASPSGRPGSSPFTGLSARLLVLTITFVMVAEFLIWAPSVAQYRKAFLEDHIASAHLAALALEATPDNMVSETLEAQLLFHANAYGITLQYSDRRTLMLSDKMPRDIDKRIDLSEGTFFSWIGDAFETFSQNKNRILLVMGPSPKVPLHASPVLVETVTDEAPMRTAMVEYSSRILQLSIVISLITASLIYISLHWLMVRPIHRITSSMMAFRENPEDLTRIITPGHRADEIGIAERELAAMQKELNAALKQKARLAALGGAVAKVNHDLRNSLATAELATDRLASIDDPEVKEVMPRLIGSIDQAVSICTQTLNYASDRASVFVLSKFHVQELVAEVAAALRERTNGKGAQVKNEIPFEIDVEADRSQMFRVLLNLVLNAHQGGAETIGVSAQQDTVENVIRIDVTDDGPGFAKKAKDKLFQPFAGSARKGGIGLGLVIALEIMRAHGGDVVLASSGPNGSCLRLTLPVIAR